MKNKIILYGFVLAVLAIVALRLSGEAYKKANPTGVIKTNYETFDSRRITKTGEWRAAFSPLPDLSGSHQTQRIPKRIFKTGSDPDNRDIETVIKNIEQK